MYLTGKRYLHDDAETKAVNSNVDLGQGSFTINGVCIDAGYWRKANMIHQWFVENVQDNEDDCRIYHVSRESLKTLYNLCCEIYKDKNANKAQELLPTQSGFFFGSTQYDDDYFEDIKLTIDIIDKALKLDERWEFYYQSSW